MNKASVLLYGKQGAVFVANHKIRLCMCKVEFGKACICHCDTAEFQQLDFSDEIGDIT